MIAFKTFAVCPESQRPEGIPLEWPWQTQVCTTTCKPGLEERGFVVVTEAYFENYLSTHQAAFDAWLATQV